MRMEKENDFSSFSKLLKQIDTKNVGMTEIKMLKQEHDYLEKLRQQRMKIEDLKQKYNDVQAELAEVYQENHQLKQTINEQNCTIEKLERDFEIEMKKREGLERNLQKQVDNDKGRNKTRILQLSHENEELKKVIKSKDLQIFTLEEQWSIKFKEFRENMIHQRKMILIECQDKVREAKSLVNEGEVNELRNLVSRQSKALNLQNEKYEEMIQKHTLLSEQIQELEQQLDQKVAEIQNLEDQLSEMSEQFEVLRKKFSDQCESEKFKEQLEDVRRKMTEMTKGQIQKIEFIVNEFQ